MEEILASIRRIIADDEASKPPAKPEPAAAAPTPVPPRPAAAPPPPPPPPPPKPAAEFKPPIPPVPAPSETSDVLDLTEAMVTAPPVPPASSFRTIDGESDVVFSDRPHEPEPVRAVEEARRQFAQSSVPDRTLMSASTMSAVDNAFNSLAHTVLGNNARTLEDLVKEMLRPMLKSWLDDNLPGLVERIVRAEIERVSRGRG
jgi:cell pole-organizing protein PopZ